jgi:hypothetical protein
LLSNRVSFVILHHLRSDAHCFEHVIFDRDLSGGAETNAWPQQEQRVLSEQLCQRLPQLNRLGIGVSKRVGEAVTEDVGAKVAAEWLGAQQQGSHIRLWRFPLASQAGTLSALEIADTTS